MKVYHPSFSLAYFIRSPVSLSQFGKQLQAEVIPGWSEYYLDYKFLKKIVSSLAAKRPASEAAALALGIRPGHSTSSNPVSGANAAVDIASQINEPCLIPTGQDDERGPDFQAHKAAFFFKLERELEKVTLISCPSGVTDRRPPLSAPRLDKRILSEKRGRTQASP